MFRSVTGMRYFQCLSIKLSRSSESIFNLKRLSTSRTCEKPVIKARSIFRKHKQHCSLFLINLQTLCGSAKCIDWCRASFHKTRKQVTSLSETHKLTAEVSGASWSTTWWHSDTSEPATKGRHSGINGWSRKVKIRNVKIYELQIALNLQTSVRTERHKVSLKSLGAGIVTAQSCNGAQVAFAWPSDACVSSVLFAVVTFSCLAFLCYWARSQSLKV